MLTNGGRGIDLFFLPLYIKWGSLAFPGLKIGSSNIPLLSLVIVSSCLAVVVVDVVEAMVVDGAVVVVECDNASNKFWLVSGTSRMENNSYLFLNNNFY